MVSRAPLRLSRRISPATSETAYTPFTPSNSGQRSPPTSYRGCWHVVSRGFLVRYRHPTLNSRKQLPLPLTWKISSELPLRRYLPPSPSVECRASSPTTEVYNPKAFFPHAASLRQACAHCGIFPTAASRRSLGRVSVPVWPTTLSGRLPIVALVGRYPANKLMGRGPIRKQ